MMRMIDITTMQSSYIGTDPASSDVLLLEYSNRHVTLSLHTPLDRVVIVRIRSEVRRATKCAKDAEEKIMLAR